MKKTSLEQVTFLHVAVGVIRNKTGQVLIALRHDNVHQGGLWEFPGGKVEAGESVQQALSRELKEELNISVQKMTPLIKIRHQYPDLKVLLDVWTVLGFSGEGVGHEGQRIQWLLPEQLIGYEFPEANKPIVSAVRLADEYAILNSVEADNLDHQLNALLDQGIQLIQIRIKALSESEVIQFFEWAIPLCKKKGVQLMVNSGVKGAEKVNVDGLHLTTADLLSLKSKPLGYAWVSASCHNINELKHAELLGIDFVVLAPVLATKTHPDTMPLGWLKFQQLIEMTNLPVFALGGLKRIDKEAAKLAGGQGISGISTFLD